MAKITAFAHLHGSGKLGSVIVGIASPKEDRDLITFGQNLAWQQDVLIYANNYTRQVQIDYQDFCKATQDL
jgi:hypothetical protein